MEDSHRLRELSHNQGQSQETVLLNKCHLGFVIRYITYRALFIYLLIEHACIILGSFALISLGVDGLWEFCHNLFTVALTFQI